MSAGLLVLPLAGHEHRTVDLVHERHRVERIGNFGPVVVVRLDLLQQIGWVPLGADTTTRMRVPAR
jgi:hypothetical protein